MDVAKTYIRVSATAARLALSLQANYTSRTGRDVAAVGEGMPRGSVIAIKSPTKLNAS